MSVHHRVFETPRLLISDAYTIGSGGRFESPEAQEKSVYYLTFRKGPADLFEKNGLATPYGKDDNRMVFLGLQRLIDKLLLAPVTHAEIDEAVAFLKNRKATTRGLRDFEFDVQMWRRVVDEFRGFPPIRIDALPEGSTFYPGEPVLRVTSLAPGFGPLAAWFESSIMKLWSTVERGTAARHWLNYNRSLIQQVDPDLPETNVLFFASLMLHDFGDRAGATMQESEDVAYAHLYSFPGTDTFSAAYQAWKNGAPAGVGTSVDALAHRVVQGFVEEEDCYRTVYEAAEPGDIISMVADCYDYFHAVENYILPLAKRSVEEGTGKVCVCRPDSGDALEQILWTLNLAVQHGLYTEKNGYKYMTTLRIIEGDGMTFESMRKINAALITKGFAPHGCLIYGVGGFLRNSIMRDNFSAKYALCAVGENNRPVIKLSEVPGKRTLPLAKVIRTPEALNSGVTVVDPWESDRDAFVNYYHPAFDDTMGPGMQDDFVTIRDRVILDFDAMPPTGGFVSERLASLRDEIADRYTRS